MEADVERCVAVAVEQLGALELRVQQRRRSHPRCTSPSTSSTPTTPAGMINITLLGSAMCLKHEVRAIRAGRRRRRSGERELDVTPPRAGRSGQCAPPCKAGVEALTRVTANENGAAGISAMQLKGGMLTPSLLGGAGRTTPGAKTQVEAGVPLSR